MTARLLTHVERRQHKPERRNASQNIGEAPCGNEPIPRRDERAMAGQQGSSELGGVEERRRDAMGALGVLDLGGGVRACRPETLRDDAKNCAIRLDRKSVV